MNDAKLDEIIKNKDTYTRYELAKEIIELLKIGYTKKKICEELHIGHSKLYDLLDKYSKGEFEEQKNMDINTNLDFKSNEIEDLKVKVVELLKQKCSRRKICKELHIGYKKLLSVLNEIDLNGIEVEANNKCEDIKEINNSNTCKELNIDNELKVLEHYGETISIWTLCEKLNLDIDTINKIVLDIEMKNRKNGVTPNLIELNKKDEFTIRDKIAYANLAYGLGGWHFVSKEELKSLIKCDIVNK